MNVKIKTKDDGDEIGVFETSDQKTGTKPRVALELPLGESVVYLSKSEARAIASALMGAAAEL